MEISFSWLNGEITIFPHKLYFTMHLHLGLQWIALKFIKARNEHHHNGWWRWWHYFCWSGYLHPRTLHFPGAQFTKNSFLIFIWSSLLRMMMLMSSGQEIFAWSFSNSTKAYFSCCILYVRVKVVKCSSATSPRICFREGIMWKGLKYYGFRVNQLYPERCQRLQLHFG